MHVCECVFVYAVLSMKMRALGSSVYWAKYLHMQICMCECASVCVCGVVQNFVNNIHM